MGWLSSLFSLDTPQRSRKVQVHDAFSLPTSSPVNNNHPDAFNPDVLSTPDQEARSYTYPPQGTVAYGYVAPSSGFNLRPPSLLPTHMDPLHTPSYPPLSKTWARIRFWLTREYPELGDTLNYGILPQDLTQIEMQFGFPLPAVVRESYLCVDGQEAESAAGCAEGLFFGLTLLPLESVLEEWSFWREVDQDPNTGANEALRQSMQSIPPAWIRREYSQRGWIPLIADKAGNYLGVDLNPGEQGSVGQIIVFGRDFDTKVVLWKGDGPAGWAKWLASFVEELESGEGFEIGATDANEGSEDEVGYESYFYDGHGRGQGDGGGDTGTGGGLRYTGEYRGWNVLEAWADRSLRKWHEAGVISDEVMGHNPEENQEEEQHQDLDIVELSMQGPAAADVAIPILSSSSEDIPRPTIDALGHHATLQPSTSKPASHLPVISVTKAPAPLPVALPTPQDIAPLPSPPDSVDFSLDDDIEAGPVNGMRELSEDVGLVSARRAEKSRPPAPRQTSDSSGSALPMSPVSPLSSPPQASSPSLEKHLPAPVVPDLFADLSTTPAMITEPMQPTSAHPEASSQAQSQMQLDTSVEAEAKEEADPDSTIRLVGGGGQTGIAQSSPVEVEAPVVAVVQESEAVPDNSASDAANKNAGKAHKRSKSSIASLKRFSQLGLRKKSDSTSITKDAPVSPSIK